MTGFIKNRDMVAIGKRQRLLHYIVFLFFLLLFCFFHNEPFTGSAVMMAASLLAICLLMFLMVG